MMTKKTWTTKDASGCEFVASVVIDADEKIIKATGIEYKKGDRRYSAFNGQVTDNTLDGLKRKVAAL